MRLPYYQINAFASHPFGGNPAGVCPLERWLPEALLQQIAAENNLAETAFFVRRDEPDGGFDLRWFTPEVEVDLCGHATLASAHVLFTELNFPEMSVRFHTRSGWLSARRRGDLVEIDLPASPPAPCRTPEALTRALGAAPRETFKARDYLAVFDSPQEVAALAPDMEALKQLEGCLGVIATARGGEGASDFVSRFFAPGAGVPEDPVTGSTHCALVPFWAERLGRTEVFARQISRRGGELFCRLDGDRVTLGGRCAIYCRGELEISDAR
jgi:predicted PhzF superfamily epimerase YddE/YHI9